MGSFDSKWVVDGRLIYAEDTGSETETEGSKVVTYLGEEITQSGQSPYTHIILDVSGLQPQYSAPGARRFTQSLLENPKLGWFLLINPQSSLVMRILTNVALQTSGTRFKEFKSLSEACVFLQEVDSTLPDLSLVGFPQLNPLPIDEWLQVNGRR